MSNKKKNEKSSKEQSQDTNPVAASETLNTAPQAGADMEKPAKPADGKGCESVTVIIFEPTGFSGTFAARSVKKYLVGVDADIQIVEGDLSVESLKKAIDYVGTERIILMSFDTLILNPVILGDIIVPKAKKTGDKLDFNTGMPVLMHKSALQSLITEAIVADMPHIDVINTYFRGTLPEGYRPLLLGDWKKDPWQLHVISKNPSIDALREYAEWKKFVHIGPDSWSDDVVAFLEKRYPEA